ncbi:hypothetical protein ORV05_01735 [Amycolatopsis cynarae]|uniref:Insulinase family protein n=1 Tax=Amycolatopsis cynarae TaxID=2995223 RepID=A0ABY7B2N9_9PSEU|nr:hypothetical protein [Amycolatopsis sp. HUAS 11-8]WAL66565.1 hypothetical protein ORV05_01735 [Amycolatopsis sp. HUAS 11-8]
MIEQIEIDGVQAVFVKRSGPTRAGLQFRVGRADEQLSTSGITHMVEHLALHRFGLTEYHSNGLTSAVATQFFASGSDSEISTFLHGVCTGLADLPLDRLETERAILRTESAARSPGALGRLARIRYGAQGYGLTGYPEYGVGRISADDVRSWAGSWFTRQNAILWIAGERVPTELDLPLPEGTRRPAPEPRPVVASAGYIESGTGRVIVESVIRRGMAGRVLALLLERELFRSLRQEGGYSYTATASYSQWGRDSATLTALADALPEQQDAVLGGVIDVLAQLKAGRLSAGELDLVRTRLDGTLAEAETEVAGLPGHAADLLMGRPARTAEELRAELAEVTAEAVHATALEALNSALLSVPDGRRADWAGYPEVIRRSPLALAGLRYPAPQDPQQGLIIGAEGCSLVDGSGARTVRYAECAGLLCWPDGGRLLIGTDGVTVPIEPTLFPIDASVIAPIDGAAARVVIALPARAPEAVPRRPVAAAPVTVNTATAPGKVKRMLSGTLAVALVLLALLSTLGMVEDPTEGEDGWLGTGILWCLALVATLAFVRVRLTRRRP